MTLLLAGVVAVALTAPHRLDLDGVSPRLAATIWTAALGLRALASIFAAIFLVMYLPPTALFSIITQWCWHAVIPVTTAHLPLSGHSFGDAALIAPICFLVASMSSVTFGLWRAARRLHTLVQRGSIGPGPRDSVVLGDGGVVVAAAGIRRPFIVISAGALMTFDDDELQASLDHEHGHIAHRHRFLLVAATVCASLGRLMPGTGAASTELAHHLERDADAFAVRRRAAPTALASAICKAASAQFADVPVTGLGGGSACRRVHHLLDGAEPVTRARLLATRSLAASLLALTLAAAIALPSAAASGIRLANEIPATPICEG